MGSLYLSKLSGQQRIDLVGFMVLQRGKCFICEAEIDLAVQKDDLDIDHEYGDEREGRSIGFFR